MARTLNPAILLQLYSPILVKTYRDRIGVYLFIVKGSLYSTSSSLYSICTITLRLICDVEKVAGIFKDKCISEPPSKEPSHSRVVVPHFSETFKSSNFWGDLFTILTSV